MSDFAVARYYFNSLYAEDALASLVHDIQKNPYIKETEVCYAFGDFSQKTTEESSYFFGTFGRIKINETVTTYDQKSKKFLNNEMPDNVDGLVHFALDLHRHLIYIEKKTDLKPERFVKKFQELYSQSASYSEIGISMLAVKRDILEEIKSLSKVTNVLFTKLRPTNPSSLPYFGNIEELIKETKSHESVLNFKTKAPTKKDEERQGLNIDGMLIREGLALSAFGYGEATVEGVKKGKDVVLKSTTHPLIETIPSDLPNSLDQLDAIGNEIQSGKILGLDDE